MSKEEIKIQLNKKDLISREILEAYKSFVLNFRTEDQKSFNLTTFECGAHEEGAESHYFEQLNFDTWFMEATEASFKKLALNKSNPALYATPHNGAYKLKHNCAEKCIQGALSSKVGEQILYQKPYNPAYNTLLKEEKHDYESKKTILEVKSIDEDSQLGNQLMKYEDDEILIKTYDYNYVISSIIKKKVNIFILDIEGHEVELLKSMRDSVEESKLPEIIAIECGWTWKERKKFLKEMNYNLDFYCRNNAVLSLNSKKIEKENESIKRINLKNPKFSFHTEKLGLIYENELI
tara:strand:- start:471 stop:1349 length:879 start_codon:yes stop_codon:yes gene_type:complete